MLDPESSLILFFLFGLSKKKTNRNHKTYGLMNMAWCLKISSFGNSSFLPFSLNFGCLTQIRQSTFFSGEFFSCLPAMLWSPETMTRLWQLPAGVNHRVCLQVQSKRIPEHMETYEQACACDFFLLIFFLDLGIWILS